MDNATTKVGLFAIGCTPGWNFWVMWQLLHLQHLPVFCRFVGVLYANSFWAVVLFAFSCFRGAGFEMRPHFLTVSAALRLAETVSFSEDSYFPLFPAKDSACCFLYKITLLSEFCVCLL